MQIRLIGMILLKLKKNEFVLKRYLDKSNSANV